ncbi:three-Cys-motif partner protein TcmP [Flavobacterium sp. 17A]|uniref:Three-Cys-motif partner protein TcmP n=1 Tax=Flavobacterium potami TaxID=2872310 RepID=A0A9X1H6S9_9FLAO|nr:three-Cys-motif partner protein TcmP [Flavobacterium potami]MBZ4033813.1 three-Cys-motif partner protein TcmP [Flavobacterium potami]
MARDINKSTFDQATKIKLDIFRESFKEWLPIFIHNKYVEKRYIYDFFAGSGMDSDLNYGSPLILLEEAKGTDLMHCSKSDGKKIVFAFNEKLKTKSKELENNVTDFLHKCLQNCGRQKCVYEHHVGNYNFKEAFNRPNVLEIMNNKKYGKFVLLDQYGFKEVDSDIFNRLINFPKTDFIFFISSSFINRFQKHASIRKYIETEKIEFKKSEPKHCHKLISQYFKNLIPKNKDYYLHQFSIKKGTNYYGLIFGTSHSLGMEKFLKVCWNQDKMAGEANFDINNDFAEGTLFYTEEFSNKIERFKEDIYNKICNKEIVSNIEGLKFALKYGIQTKIYLETILSLIDKGKIKITKGTFNKKVTSIHKFTSNDLYEFCIK